MGIAPVWFFIEGKTIRKNTLRQRDLTDVPPRKLSVATGGAVQKKGMKRGESRTSPRRIKAIEEKQHAALKYRRMGYTYSQIAEAVGYSGRQGAFEAIQSALARVIREPAEDVSSLDLERLDAMFVNPYLSALNGDLAAMSACLIIMARRAKLLGLDAAANQQLSGLGGVAIKIVEI